MLPVANRLRSLVAVLFFAMGLLRGTAAGAKESAWHKAHCAQADSRYILFRPAEIAGTSAWPVMVLLHGAGDSPDPMIEAWRKLARQQGIALVAPELPRDARFEPIAPQIFRCDVEDAAKIAPLDLRRAYLFGNSMGGYLAYDGAMLASDFFAAAAVHAMGIAPDYDWIVTRAKRKTPVAIYIGLEDPLVALAGVQRTRDLLRARQFPVHYVEIRNHDHNYYAVSDKVNPDAWNFLRQYRLETK